MRFTTDQIAAVTGGEVFGRPSAVDGASIDSRVLLPGQLFVPVVAERDGHDFIGTAVAAGAGAYLTAGPIGAGTAVRVDNTAAALTALGAAARDRLGHRVVGVTGSVGKTSLKDLLAATAGAVWRTTASVGSFNNELGVPLTLCNAPDDTECAVVEMGARGRGHIEDLCEIARPTVGVVTAVAGVHLELFRTIEEVAEAKSELVASLPVDGTAVLNADDERVVAMAAATAAAVLTFGVDAGEVRAAHVTLDEHLHSRFELRTPWGSAPVHLPVAGRHQVTNALGAAAAALSLGAPLEAVVEGLGGARLSAMRMDLIRSEDGFRVLDDAYNASPTSVEAALRSLVDLAADRRFAVLGTMAELGDDAAAHHHDVAVLAAELGIAVISVAEPRYRIAGPDAVADTDAAVARLRELGVGDGDVVLVKGSRSAGLERVVRGLVPDRPTPTGH
jgi:UDP-N-acetylmuramoyl-tripeptide--D-alanyl-D-alanine ligase